MAELQSHVHGAAASLLRAEEGEEVQGWLRAIPP
ncbi:hypothetical protein A2U01_0102616 [Trifolium medium]|uniref:Uncharacterized protein n=1 Tax=Trifolium medium TaxID=97028 RepID=A0A392V1M0_9FABA|nr:hypothetical protein [Trifolium medium]